MTGTSSAKIYTTHEQTVPIWLAKSTFLRPILSESLPKITAPGIQHEGFWSKRHSGLNKGGKSWAKAESDGHTVFEVSEACAKADIVHVLIPDMVQAKTFKEQIASKLSEGNALSFSQLQQYTGDG